MKIDIKLVLFFHSEKAPKSMSVGVSSQTPLHGKLIGLALPRPPSWFQEDFAAGRNIGIGERKREDRDSREKWREGMDGGIASR